MRAIDEFRTAIEQAGLTPPETIVADGKIHRFPSNGDSGDDAGWYILFSDGLPAGSFGDWRLDLKQNWCAKPDRIMTAAERADYRARCEAARQQREIEERRRHAEAASWAQQLWEQAPPATDKHPYLLRKQIPAHGLRLDPDGDLIVPVLIDGQLASLQSIGNDGRKMFLPGGQVTGGSFTLGELHGAKTILLCEGFATAASVFEATDYPTVCAFSAGNLLHVAQTLREQFPSAVIVLAGDNDVRDDGKPNVGVDAATAAAQAIDGLLVIPKLDGQKCDFNDLHVHSGLGAVKGAIEAVLTRTPETEAVETVCTDREPGLTKSLADEILRTDHFARDAGGQLYVYHEGVYRPQGEARITQRVKAILLNNGETKRWSSHRAREVVAYIHVDAPVLWERPPVDVLNCRNGLLSLPAQALRPHTPDHLSLVQLPVAYDPTATCPLWESFIEQVLPDDCRGYPYELVAGSMCGDVSDQMAALAVGIGETGKSTLLDAVSACLGRENVTNLALHRLENDKFSVVRLLGKLANICADLPSEHLTSTSTFKALTGGDSLTAERKFQSSFELRPFCRLIFSANHYPQSRDNSSAFFRRWLVIPFDIVIEPHQRIPKFAAQLADPRELSGVLNRALLVLPDMQRRGGFSQCETTQAAMQEFREMTDPLAAWVDRFTVLAVDKLVTKKDLLIAYNGQAETSGRPPMTPKSFYAGVKRLRPTLTEAQRTVCGEVKHVFLGLGLRATSAISTNSVSAPEGLFAEEVVDDH